jgi:hypothetical protein
MEYKREFKIQPGMELAFLQEVSLAGFRGIRRYVEEKIPPNCSEHSVLVFMCEDAMDRIGLVEAQPAEPAEDWPAKYRDLKIRAVAKNAGLIRALRDIQNKASFDLADDETVLNQIREIASNAQNAFRLNEQVEPEIQKTAIQRSAECEPYFAAERAELVTTLNKIVYHYRNGRGKKLAKAIWNADKLIQEYV